MSPIKRKKSEFMISANIKLCDLNSPEHYTHTLSLYIYKKTMDIFSQNTHKLWGIQDLLISAELAVSSVWSTLLKKNNPQSI